MGRHPRSLQTAWVLAASFALAASVGCGNAPQPTVPWSPIPGAQTSAWPGATSFQVRTSFNGTCPPGNARIQLTSGPQRLGQWTLPPNSHLELHVAPGIYDLLADLGPGSPCSGAQRVQAQANYVVPVTLWIAPHYAGIWDKLTGLFGANRAPAQAPSSDQVPCHWTSRGCDGAQLPAAATALLANSHLNWTAPGSRLQIRMKPLARALRTHATPIHGIDGWNVRREASDETSGDIAYGLSFSEQDMQRENGFCVAQPDLMTMLLKHLRDRGHTASAMKDFESYWTARLPNALRYCVYPQEDKQIEQLAALEIKPRPARVLRTWFWIVPIEERLARGPTPPSKYRTNPVTREPAADSRLEEAGVVFPVDPAAPNP